MSKGKEVGLGDHVDALVGSPDGVTLGGHLDDLDLLALVDIDRALRVAFDVEPGLTVIQNAPFGANQTTIFRILHDRLRGDPTSCDDRTDCHGRTPLYHKKPRHTFPIHINPDVDVDDAISIVGG